MTRFLLLAAVAALAGCGESAAAGDGKCTTRSECRGLQVCWCQPDQAVALTPADRRSCVDASDLPAGECVARAEARTRDGAWSGGGEPIVKMGELLATRACACKDKACADLAIAEYDQLAGDRTALPAGEAEREKFWAAGRQFGECVSAKGGESERALKAQRLASRACGCADRDCAQRAQAELEELIDENLDRPVIESDEEKISKAAARAAGCLAEKSQSE